jgi:ribosomal-protein-alanine N-acetyltransferase
MMDVYDKCPVYHGKIISLRQTTMEDASALLSCYSDEKAVPFFNSDNCNGDDFFYRTIERMEQAIRFWGLSYKNKYFVRWSIVECRTNMVIGTAEMFHRKADDKFDGYGVLRIDLMSKFEKAGIIADILEIAERHFYDDFHVKHILTKAIPSAVDRRKALESCGWSELGEKMMTHDDYFVK